MDVMVWLMVLVLVLQWTALEAATSGKFTTAADVWSFGVVLWELATMGREPYEEMADLLALLSQLARGYRMPQPRECPKDLYGRV